ncbi:dephospho-CoA kinase, partial [Lactobacillus sp. XV13L]|nr:dephospho-CoA kinase [Lactobacillus sp. XV13L]
QSYCDRTLLIALPADVQVKRLMQRDHLTQDAALARIHSQMPLVKKEKLADYVVFNTGTIEDLEAELRKLLVQIKEEDQHGMS